MRGEGEGGVRGGVRWEEADFPYLRSLEVLVFMEDVVRGKRITGVVKNGAFEDVVDGIERGWDGNEKKRANILRFGRSATALLGLQGADISTMSTSSVTPQDILDFWFGKGNFGDAAKMNDPSNFGEQNVMWFGMNSDYTPATSTSKAQADAKCCEYIPIIRAAGNGEYSNDPSWSTPTGLYAREHFRHACCLFDCFVFARFFSPRASRYCGRSGSTALPSFGCACT